MSPSPGLSPQPAPKRASGLEMPMELPVSSAANAEPKIRLASHNAPDHPAAAHHVVQRPLPNAGSTFATVAPQPSPSSSPPTLVERPVTPAPLPSSNPDDPYDPSEFNRTLHPQR
jgi:hypothetical protein